MSKKKFVFVLVLVVVASPLLASIGVSAQAVDNSTTTNQTSEYTLVELQEGGQQMSGAPPSLRWLGDRSSMYVDYEETNPLKDMSNPNTDWSVENLLTTGTTVPRDEIRFHYQGARSTANESYTLHIVYWERGERETSTENGVVREPAAVNVTHETSTLSFSSAFDVETVDLSDEPRYYDQGTRVTMWIDGQEGARWTFFYKPLPTSRGVSTDTAGERLWWLLKYFVSTLLVTGILAAAFILYAREKAKAGPQYGLGAWAFLIFVGGFFALYYGYDGISTIFIRAPVLLAIGIILLLTLIQIEGMDDHLADVRFVRPVVTSATSTSGDSAVDAIRVESQEEKIAQLPSGKMAVIRPGMGKFLARLFGGAAIIQNGGDRLKTRIFDEGKAKTDEWVWVHYNAPEVLDYDPEGFSFDLDGRDLQGAAALLILIGVGMTWLVGWTAAMTSVGAAIALGLPFVTTVHNGTARVAYASAHERAAWASMMYASIELANADTLEESREQVYKERSKSAKDVDEQVEERDLTLINEMVGGEVSAKVTDDRLKTEFPELDQQDEPLDAGEDESGGEDDG